MSSLVIVAIPREDDPVWKVSTEKKPHLTLLFLGDANNPNRDHIAQFMMHAANVCLTRFSLDVDRRGELGVDKADVVFFDNMWEMPKLKQFRSQLLLNETIRTAYDSAEQFPDWQPHLTLGYPETPAKDNAIDYPIIYVAFDRIALWDGDYEGVELILKREYYNVEEMAMSGSAEAGKTAVEEVLSHHGVKGMKWGVRSRINSVKETAAKNVAKSEKMHLDKNPSQPISVKTSVNRGKATVKTKGGKNQRATEDAVAAKIVEQKLKKSGIHSLSNEELRVVATRLQLEQQVSSLQGKRPESSGKAFIKRFMKDPENQKKLTELGQKHGAKLVAAAIAAKAAKAVK